MLQCSNVIVDTKLKFLVQSSHVHPPGRLALPKTFSVRMSKDAITWAQASDGCRKLGAELATVTSRVENDKLHNLAKVIDEGRARCGNRVWIGLESSATSPVRTEGTWFWQDGTQLTFQNWARTQQDGGGPPPYCGGMYPWGNSNGAPGTWFQNKCTTQNIWCYACQRKKTGIRSICLPQQD